MVDAKLILQHAKLIFYTCKKSQVQLFCWIIVTVGLHSPCLEIGITIKYKEEKLRAYSKQRQTMKNLNLSKTRN